MNTRLQKTQNQQLENFLKKQPEIEGDQKQIFQALKEHGPATIEEIGNKIGKPQHTISGRFGELQEKDLIQVKGLTVNDRGYKCKLWEVAK